MSKPSDILNEKWVTVPEERPEPIAQPTSATAKERVITEQESLQEKMTKLNSYLLTDHYAGLPEEQRYLLQLQGSIMLVYLDILQRRLDIWKD